MAKAKLEVIQPPPPPPPERKVVIELSVHEAKVLHALVGSIGGSGIPGSPIQINNPEVKRLLHVQNLGEYHKGPRGLTDSLYDVLEQIPEVSNG